MKFSATPYVLNLRRAKLLQVLLFGAFVYFYATRLHPLFFTQLEEPLLHSSSATLAGILLAATGMTLFYIIGTFIHFPKTWSGERRLSFWIIIIFAFCYYTGPTEEQAAINTSKYYAKQRNYDKALDIQSRYTHPTCELLSLRAQILQESKHGICNEFFTLPIGKVNAKEAEQIVHSNSFISPHLFHLELLLNRDLDGFASAIKDIPTGQLERAEIEAIILYMHLRANPIIVVHNSNIEANYRDFTEYKNKLEQSNHYTKLELANLIGDTYGDTYWHYYFYGKYR